MYHHIQILQSSELYSITKCDWTYNISGSLTEPICSVVWVGPESSNITRYCRTINRDSDALKILDELCYVVYNEIVLKLPQLETSNLLFSNPDDETLIKWLTDRWNGADKELIFLESYK